MRQKMRKLGFSLLAKGKKAAPSFLSLFAVLVLLCSSASAQTTPTTLIDYAGTTQTVADGITAFVNAWLPKGIMIWVGMKGLKFIFAWAGRFLR